MTAHTFSTLFIFYVQAELSGEWTTPHLIGSSAAMSTLRGYEVMKYYYSYLDACIHIVYSNSLTFPILFDPLLSLPQKICMNMLLLFDWSHMAIVITPNPYCANTCTYLHVCMNYTYQKRLHWINVAVIGATVLLLVN